MVVIFVSNGTLSYLPHFVNFEFIFSIEIYE
jgi:hypothetical protein